MVWGSARMVTKLKLTSRRDGTMKSELRRRNVSLSRDLHMYLNRDRDSAQWGAINILGVVVCTMHAMLSRAISSLCMKCGSLFTLLLSGNKIST